MTLDSYGRPIPLKHTRPDRIAAIVKKHTRLLAEERARTAARALEVKAEYVADTAPGA